VARITAKTKERYWQLAEQQIIPHVGAITLQKLRPSQIAAWHDTLLQHGGKDGKPLSARTVGHAHRVLHTALARAAAAEIVARNVASSIKPPKIESEEVQILGATDVRVVLDKTKDHPLGIIIALALATGARRGELLGLRWGDVDIDAGMLRIERSVEETKAGLSFETPKTKNGRRQISLPPTAVDLLRDHRRKQLELRVQLGLGRDPSDALLFGTVDGAPLSPDNLSRDWRRVVVSLSLPPVMFHALRHSHASALIAAGMDPVTVSKRLGHGSPAMTLTVYAHLFQKTDLAAASAIEAAMRGKA
jgi:integrase